MRYKYKDLTTDSYILLEIHSMQFPEEKSLLGTTKIYLFNENFNLCQGRHIFKINKTHFNQNQKQKQEKEEANKIANKEE